MVPGFCFPFGLVIARLKCAAKLSLAGPAPNPLARRCSLLEWNFNITRRPRQQQPEITPRYVLKALGFELSKLRLAF